MENSKMVSLSNEEIESIEGGVIIELAALALAYCTWAAGFCYQLGKD